MPALDVAIAVKPSRSKITALAGSQALPTTSTSGPWWSASRRAARSRCVDLSIFCVLPKGVGGLPGIRRGVGNRCVRLGASAARTAHGARDEGTVLLRAELGEEGSGLAFRARLEREGARRPGERQIGRAHV